MDFKNQGDCFTWRKVGMCSRLLVPPTFNLSTLGAEAGNLYELEASLVMRVGSRTAKATQRSPIMKMGKKKFPGQVGQIDSGHHGNSGTTTPRSIFYYKI